VAFRFCFLYFGLFALATQVAGSLLPIISFRGLGPLWPMRDITLWIALHVFGLPPTSASLDPGKGGETVFFGIQIAWILVVAVAGAGLWSFVDRKTTNYNTLRAWFRLFLRLGLAAQMLEYGMTKIIPNQFESPSLMTLVTPVGNLSLNSLLWTSIGAAPGYQIFTGVAELLAGILLIIPRTTLMGAILCLADLALVLSLNLSYDIGLKLTTVHLVLLTLYLLSFYATRMRVSEPPLFKSAGANRLAVGAQVIVGIYLVLTLVYINVNFWYAKGGGSPRSVLYGIWDVEQLSVDGVVQVPVLNDYDRRWRRAIFDNPDRMVFQRSDDSFAHFNASIDNAQNTVSLTKPNSSTWRANFNFRRPAPDRLLLEGEMDGYRIEAKFRLVEFDTFPVLNSGFRWVRPAAP
jgi:hypothetical protein